MVPEEVVLANCLAAGYDEAAIRDELTELVEHGTLCKAGDCYGRESEGDKTETLRLQTHRGDESMPWQFSLVRTGDELILTQARGPSEKFDPVLKRFAIEERSLGDDPIEAHHSVIRRVWREDSTRPHVRSQRSEGHIIELLYRDPTGRHLARPDQREDTATTPDDSEYHPTDHPGVYVSTTFIRSEDGADMKYTEERDYRITAELLEQYAEVYLLSYYEVNEESVDRATWKTEEAVAYRLVR